MARPIVKYLDPISGEYEFATVVDVGDLRNLNTTIKSDIVSAINSIVSGGVHNPITDERIEDLQKIIDSLKDGTFNIEDFGSIDEYLKQQFLDELDRLNAQNKAEMEDVLTKLDTSVDDAIRDYQERVVAQNIILENAENTLADARSTLETKAEELETANIGFSELKTEFDELDGYISTNVRTIDFDNFNAMVEDYESVVTQTSSEVGVDMSGSTLSHLTGRVTDAEANISVQADEITSKMGYDEFQYMPVPKYDYGENLLFDTFDFGDAWNGKNGAQVTPDTFLFGKVVAFNSPTGLYETRTDDLTIGESYVLSTYVNVQPSEKSPSQGKYEPVSKSYDPTDFTVQIGGASFNPGIYEDLSGVNGWVRINQEFVADSVNPIISITPTGVNSQNEVAYMAMPKVEKGLTVTPWQPHVEDNYATLSSTQSMIKQQANSITAFVTGVEELDESYKQATSTFQMLADGFKANTEAVEVYEEAVTRYGTEYSNINGKFEQRVWKDDFDAAIEDINIDNRNRVLNSDFIRNEISSSDRKLIVEDWSLNSDWEIKTIDDNKYLSRSRTGLTQNLITSASSNYFPVRDGERTLFGFDLIHSGLDNDKVFAIELFDINDKRLLKKEFSLSSLTKVGNRYHDSFNISTPGVQKGRVVLQLPRNGSVSFTKISFQNADIGSIDWSPAPEDSWIIQSKLESYISQVEDEITIGAVGQKVDTLTGLLTEDKGTFTLNPDKIATEVFNSETYDDMGLVNKTNFEQTADGWMQEITSKGRLAGYINATPDTYRISFDKILLEGTTWADALGSSKIMVTENFALMGQNGTPVLSVNNDGSINMNVTSLKVGPYDALTSGDKEDIKKDVTDSVIETTEPYIHIAYADTEDGGGLSFDPSGKEYIGLSKSSSTISSKIPSDYTWSKWMGKDGSNGIPGPKGDDGRTQYLHIAYANSADGISGFDTEDSANKLYIGTYTDFYEPDSQSPSKYSWTLIKGEKGDTGEQGPRGLTGAQGPKGDQGIEGKKGADGKPSYTHIAYADTITGSGFSHSDASKPFIGIYADDSPTSSGTASKYTWSKWHGEDGSDGVQGPKGKDGLPSYTHFAYASNATGTSGFSTTDSLNKSYLGIYTDSTKADSEDPGKYNWTLIKGATGAQGPRGIQGLQGPEGKQGIKGDTGANGKSSYTHIAYATGNQGQSFNHSTFEQATYVGMYVSDNQNSSDNWRDYEWTLIKGRDGSQGIQGPKGTDGKTPYFHIAYANNATGTSGFSINDSANKLYIGTYTDFTSTDSKDPSKYSWTLVKGAKGDTGPQGPQGIQGPSGSNGQSQWVHIRYSPNPTGSGMTPNPSSTTKYVGIAVTNSATAPAFPEFTWSKYVGEKGEDGPPGQPGGKGADGKTTYTWVRYADTPTSGMENFPDGKKYIGLAFNQTTQTESNNYNDYQWSLMPQNIKVGGRNYWALEKRPWFSYLKHLGDGVFTNNSTSSSFAFMSMSKLGVDVGEEYTLSFEIKVTDESTQFIHNTMYISSLIPNATHNKPTLIKDKWVKVFSTFNYSEENTTYAHMYINNIPSNDSIEFRNFKLEKGNTATDWTPAPEDLYKYSDDVAQAKAEAERIKAEAYADGKVTAEEKERIAQAEQVLKDAKAHALESIENIDIGGRNLVLNTKGKLYRTFGSGATLSEVDGATRLTWTGTAQTSMGEKLSVPLIIGETYTLSFEARGAMASPYLEACILASSGANLNISNYLSDRVVTEKFKKYTATFKFTGNPSDRLFIGGRGPSGKWLEIKDATVKIEKGNKATDWSPAPEDLYQYVDNVEVGSTNLLKDSRTIFLSSNNHATYPVSITSMEESGRSFSRIRRTSLNLSPSTFSIYSSMSIEDINKSIFENESTVVSFKARASQNVTMSTMNATYGGSPTVNGSLGSINVTTEWKTFYSIFPKIPKSASGLRVNPLNNITDVNMSTFYLDLCEWKIEKGNKPTDWSPAPEDVQSQINKSVKSTDVEYYLSTSSTGLSGGRWQTTAPDWVNGRYMWSRTKVVLNDGTTSYNPSTTGTNITGAKGSTGSTGAAGKGVSSITEEYYLSNSKTSRVGGVWTTNAPTWSTGKYMWTRSKIVWSNPTDTTYTTPIVDNSWEAVNEIEVGGRNLLRNSGEKVSNGSYRVARYDLTDSIKEGEEVTLTIWGSLAATKSYFSAYNSGGMVNLTTLTDNRDGTYSRTFKWRIGGSTNAYLDVYAFTNSQTGTSTINKIKLEKGNKSTDWTPAPEDLYKYVDDIEIGGANLLNNSDKIYSRDISVGNLNWRESNYVDLDLTTGDEYVFSVYLRADSTVNITNPIFLNPQNRSSANAGAAITTTWKRFIYPIVWKGGTYNGAVFAPHIYHTTSGTGYIYATKPQLEKGNKVTDWSPSAEDVAVNVNKKTYNPVRYIRDWANGSTTNTGNHWYELMAIDEYGNNKALNRPVTSNGTSSNLHHLTNGVTSIGTYASSSNGGKPVYLQVDLGKIYYDIAEIKVWKYYNDGRTYNQNRTEVSSDGVTWYPIYDYTVEGEYTPTAQGKSIPNTIAKTHSILTGSGTKNIIDQKADGLATESALNEAAASLQVLHQEIEAAATSNELSSFIDQYNKDMESRDSDARESEENISKALSAASRMENNMKEMSETWTFIDRFIKNTPEGIVVGNDSSGSYILMKEDRISFYSNGQEVAFISQNLMEISRGAFVEEIQVAKYKFEETTNNHLTIRYVG